ncbi:MAG: 2,3-bisphosphoglycerate-independent phosphoglycerate mutase [Oscillatoriales cyanobacterium RM2_1_1]|nr:2,3-bisphosphoglycerate-independent phosphoglycerate mutase [Oscillatoriales cyanobacterium SM2_3_0]NJO44600.1 2,3-bisphosphoglycerate-independent phosphoglycerate mutase [Oscillatoriales cyanobacterium RM2_1_1]
MSIDVTDISTVWEQLAWERGGKIVYIVIDGVGGIPDAEHHGTELQVAQTPNLDQMAQQSSCGLLEIVGPGITPGSGPGHLALFGYDPLRYNVGRGILSALGIEFDLQPGDVAARVNFATLDDQGRVSDRRAGRIDTELNQKLCDKINQKVHLDFPGEYFFKTVSQHRAVFVLRGTELGGQLADTDPQSTGMAPHPVKSLDQASQATAELVDVFAQQVNQVLADEKPANTILMRGFDQYQPFASLQERFKLSGVCIADYPMYRGVSRLVGMKVLPRPGGMKPRFQALVDCYGDDYDFYFLHVKHSDSLGEDEDFSGKVAVLEAVDQLMPLVTALQPDVLVVTADHSTPAVLGKHSWHPVPVMIQAKTVRVDSVSTFDEYACGSGSLGLRPGVQLIGLALAHAQRLKKFGA